MTATDNILCCACPGSGKTHVLVEKVKHVLHAEPESRIIMTTFSRDAAREMRDRIKASLPADERDRLLGRLVIGTFHALAMRQLRDAGQQLQVLGPIETSHLIRRALELTRVDIPWDEAEELVYACKVDPSYAAANPRAALLAQAYQRELETRRYCDFADLLLMANDLMKRGKVAPIAATHVFADEMQDIDAIQLRWLRYHLAGKRVACAVGDDDQSIYAFRASLGHRGMMDFQAMTGARIITLDINYRSTGGILRHAGRLIACNTDRIQKNLRAQRGDGPVPRVVCIESGDPQALSVIAELDRICAGNPLPRSRNDRTYRFGVRHGQAAVLARTNRQLDHVERVFVEHRVPCQRAGASFWDDRTAQVFVVLLGALHRREGTGIEVALRWAGVTDANVRRLQQSAGGNLHALAAAGRSVSSIYGAPAVALFENAGHWDRRLAQAPDDQDVSSVIDGVAEWLLCVIGGTCGMDEQSVRGSRAGNSTLRRQESLVRAIHRILTKGVRGSIPARIAMARMEGESMPSVVLSTFHSSKGLEWDHVFLVDVDAASVPKLEEGDGDAQVEEERRVFYVAMTRARDTLTIYTRQDPSQSSEFLIDAGLADGIGRLAA